MDSNATSTENIRPLYSEELERELIGRILINSSALESINSFLGPENFYFGQHRVIWSSLLELSIKDEAVNAVSVYSQIQENGEAHKIPGGLSYLAELARNHFGGNEEHYARKIVEYSDLRRFASTVQDIYADGMRSKGDVPTLVASAQNKLQEISDSAGSDDELSVNLSPADHIKNVINKLDDLMSGKQSPYGLSTGFPSFDKQIMGMHPGDVIVIGGRPSMGKTAFMLEQVKNCAVAEKRPVYVSSMEMSTDQLYERLIANVGDFSYTFMKNPVNHPEMDECLSSFAGATMLLKEAPLVIDDRPAMTPSQILAAAKMVKRKYGDLGLIAIDYLQLMEGDDKKNFQNDNSRVSENSRKMKLIAKVMGCPVIILSQLNRSLEQRPNKRPVMSDLRESGAIEQDADVIAFLYRDEVYTKEACQCPGVLELLVEKARNAQTGVVRLASKLNKMKFTEIDAETAMRLHAAANHKEENMSSGFSEPF